eukprot:1139093-Amphidinium_carterae.1
MDDWHRIDNQTQSMLWLDHSISAWATAATQWHLNEYIAIAMLNTRSMSHTFRNWCENNGLNVFLNKYLTKVLNTTTRWQCPCTSGTRTMSSS